MGITSFGTVGRITTAGVRRRRERPSVGRLAAIPLGLACAGGAPAGTAPSAVEPGWPVGEEPAFETWLATGASWARDTDEAWIAIELTPLDDVAVELGLIHGRERVGDEGDDDEGEGEDGDGDGDGDGEDGGAPDSGAADGSGDDVTGGTANRYRREIELALEWTAYTFDGDDRLDEGPALVLFVEGSRGEERGAAEPRERERVVRAGAALEWPLSERFATGFGLYRERVSDADGRRTDTGAVFGFEAELGERVALAFGVERLYDDEPVTESAFALVLEVHERLLLSIGHDSARGEPDEVSVELFWSLF